MNAKRWVIFGTILWLHILTMLVSHAAANSLDFSGATPVGSWQVREETTTDARGRQTLTVVKTSMLEKVAYQGAPHYWIETAIETYKLRKNKRKAQGDPVTMKVLVEASVMGAEPENVAANLQKYGKEIIFQSGNSDPMRIVEGGALAQMMMKSLGVSVEYQYTKEGSKTVEVPAGKYKCTIMRGNGTTEMRVLMRKVSISSEIETCMSAQVPFGIVAYTSISTENGKETRSEARLIEFGKSGAVSQITKAPVDMPEMPKLF